MESRLPRLTLVRLAMTVVFAFSLLVNFSAHAVPTIQNISNKDYFPATLTAINNAQQDIKIAMYCVYIHTGEVDNPVYKLVEALSAAQKRGVKVTIYLDSTQGNAKANQTAAAMLITAGAKVFFTQTHKLHAKLIVIDNETVIEGSANWTEKALQDNWEANTLIKDKDIAHSKAAFFDRLDVKDAQIAPVVAVPVSFVNVAAAMTSHKDGAALDLYLNLLRQHKEGYIDINYIKTANELGIRINGTKGAYRRLLRDVAQKLKVTYGVADYTLDKDYNLKIRLLPPAGASFGLPETYWTSGANRRLTMAEKLFCLIGYAQGEAARPNPYWSRSMKWMSQNYHVSRFVLSSAATGLRHKDILEIDFARATGDDFKNKDASSYRMKGFLSEEERRELWDTLGGEYSQELVAQGRELAARINEEENVTTVREFIELVRQYAYPRVLKATQKIACYAPQNPLRNVYFIAGVVKNEP